MKQLISRLVLVKLYKLSIICRSGERENMICTRFDSFSVTYSLSPTQLPANPNSTHYRTRLIPFKITLPFTSFVLTVQSRQWVVIWNPLVKLYRLVILSRSNIDLLSIDSTKSTSRIRMSRSKSTGPSKGEIQQRDQHSNRRLKRYRLEL